ncbi:hypothetical protein M8J71_03870 [Pseudarthrobacter sp. R1]|uniref:hypothetical protein n=1 Tax=Pseudarthrobacter sp. R1 TaxID=2944934 RepID=UPI00210A3B19|nr:hypothetical protein [Pseudarthrobacter sp. R1]MCQ6269626.1 hypothetical protein [Pseudarthrobacter sp. R1]
MSDTAGSRGGSVDQLLLEADLDGDTQLRPVLLELQALASDAPEPSAELLAMMAGANAGLGADPEVAEAAIAAAPADELAARRRAKRRTTLTALSVAVSLSAGGAVAAASDQSIRESFTQLNQAVTSFITGSGGAPAGHQADQPAVPVPESPAGTGPAGTAPAGTAPAGPTSIPADPAAATQPTAPPSDGPVAPETAASQPTSPGKPGEVPALETLPGAVPEHIANGLGGSPEVRVPPQVPLPATLPAVPLP